jgi:hypothetical protein
MLSAGREHWSRAIGEWANTEQCSWELRYHRQSSPVPEDWLVSVGAAVPTGPRAIVWNSSTESGAQRFRPFRVLHTGLSGARLCTG